MYITDNITDCIQQNSSWWQNHVGLNSTCRIIFNVQFSNCLQRRNVKFHPLSLTFLTIPVSSGSGVSNETSGTVLCTLTWEQESYPETKHDYGYMKKAPY